MIFTIFIDLLISVGLPIPIKFLIFSIETISKGGTQEDESQVPDRESACCPVPAPQQPGNGFFVFLNLFWKFWVKIQGMKEEQELRDKMKQLYKMGKIDEAQKISKLFEMNKQFKE